MMRDEFEKKRSRSIKIKTNKNQKNKDQIKKNTNWRTQLNF